MCVNVCAWACVPGYTWKKCTIVVICSVLLCGFWSLPSHFYPPPDPDVTALFDSLPSPPLYVGYGSMETYMTNVDWTTFINTLEEGTYYYPPAFMWEFSVCVYVCVCVCVCVLCV